MDSFAEEAADLDRSDPLRWTLARFAPLDPDVIAYLDGNSLGRPLSAALDDLASFAGSQWRGRLIRGWQEGWMDWPVTLGDELGQAALGAAPGQVVVADSTTVLLYKLAWAALDARPGRRTVVVDRTNFPTDRYVLEAIAEHRSLELVALDPSGAGGIDADQVDSVLGSDVALVVLSHVSYRSGWLADAAAVTAAAHRHGALVLWDLSHSAGCVEVELDRWGADMAVGCGYKYLNGGPGAPGYAYVAEALTGQIGQPIRGWMGHADPFDMEAPYRAAPGVRRLLSGTPPISAMVALRRGVELVGEAGIAQIRAKSVKLTDLALRMAEEWLTPLGVSVASPRDPARRGGHLTLRGDGFAALNERLWARGVIPDFRPPDAIRLGLAPLSTSFGELHAALAVMRAELTA